MDQITQLTKKRGSIKAKVTTFKNYLEKVVLSNPDPNKKIEDDDREEINIRLAAANEVFTQFDSIQVSIDSLSENPDNELQYRETFENEYFANVKIAKRLLARGIPNIPSITPSNRPQQVPLIAQDGINDNNNIEQLLLNMGNNNIRQGIKLPTIELPKFDGNLSEWLGFRDTFDSLIHQNNSISDIQKFHYLKAALSGTAGQIVKSLEFSAINYEVAWTTLCDRFNSTKLLIHNHIKAIFEIKNMSDESAEQIRGIIDTLTKHLRALDILGQATHHWDAILIYIISNKLDQTTLRAWEQEKSGADEIPALQKFTDFLSARAEFLQTLESRKQKGHQSSTTNNKHTKVKTFLASDKTKSCILCKESHFIQNCAKFIELDPRARAEKLKELKACLNCLRPGHFVSDCRFGPCKKCQGKHNTLIHYDKPHATSSVVTLCASNTSLANIILPTALVQIHNKDGYIRKTRAILDSCSQSNFITENLCNALNLKKTPINIGVDMLNNNEELNIRYKCELELEAHHNAFKLSVTCLIIPKITGDMPNKPISLQNIQLPSYLKLADPTFHLPSSVDILIGGQWFWDLLCVGQVQLNSVGLVMQKTKLGWVVGGPTSSPNPQSIQCFLTRQTNIAENIQKFWEIEEIATTRAYSHEEKKCEEIFVKTLKRDANGRFIVNIPFKDDPKILGESKHIAKRRLTNLERKFKKQPNLKNDYVAFLEEYERLGHMTKVVNEDPKEKAYYLPHHCVIKNESTSTKTRVVFDGSAATSNGISLNHIQMVGPVIQNDLFNILIRFRKHTYIISSDIEKMYRQVLINPEQRSLQRILWRSNPDEPMQIYNLNTVTYGTASASFLSIRSVVQLALECESELPEISKIILNDFYADDLLTGADSITKTKYIANNVLQVLAKGCFPLKKWTSNYPSTITDVCSNNSSPNNVNLAPDGTIKTLGLRWNPKGDALNYLVKNINTSHVSKRQILSEVSQIFDPLGLLGPIIITAKILLQDLWREKVSWDESISLQLHQNWIRYKQNLQHLNNFEIPRHAVCKKSSSIELHGFADASQLAYGACIYIRSKDQIGNSHVSLLCAKSKVAPLKTQTIPRLELCGALLLAKLVAKVEVAIDTKINNITYWTDSSIVLAWLRHSPNSLPVFISNRVAQIQDLTNIENWRHVPTKQNPADCLSRGVCPREIKNHILWWKGPAFLLNEQDQWPTLLVNPTTNEEVKNTSPVTLHVINHENHIANYLINRFSSINKSSRVLAYVMRFISKLKQNHNIETGYLKSNEINDALTYLIKSAQNDSFKEELKLLRDGKIITKGKLISLAPFIDEKGVLRVGGRLANSKFTIDKKFPILIDSKHRLTKQIMHGEHLRLLHAGPQLLLASIRERFWPIRGRDLARKIVKECSTCFRAKPIAATFNMGNLPTSRVSPSPPFTIVGVDYAGPFLIKDKRGRGAKLVKCYISLFICFTTKALHLEVVSDLTKDSFIAALRRFVARRGKPSDIYSDNGSTFVGAHNELCELGQFLLNQNQNLGESIDNCGIRWHFIPAYSPHFGGIWEAGVKSVKFHLKRIAGNAHLLYEEFYTLLAQVEAILNSRPLCPLSNDPNDLLPLTPAHFLIGRSYLTVPDPSLLDEKENRLSNWQRVQALQQHLWARWNKEYISELQRITKWQLPFPEIKNGNLVLLKDDNLAPSKWKLGRIIETHPGKDNVTRVATIRTATGIFKRALTRLCPLPIDKSAQ